MFLLSSCLCEKGLCGGTSRLKRIRWGVGEHSGRQLGDPFLLVAAAKCRLQERTLVLNAGLFSADWDLLELEEI